MHFDNYYIGKIPIPKISHKEQHPIIVLVDQILTAKQQHPLLHRFDKGDFNADTLVLEKKIDQMVYKLYDLTPEEIAIVEGRK